MASDTKVREACWMRVPLDGADAQALEGALQQLERENAELRRDRDAAEKAAHDNADMYRRHVETLREWNESQPDCKVAPAYIEACARAEAAEAQLQAEREHIAHLRAEAQQAEREREAAEVREAELRARVKAACESLPKLLCQRFWYGFFSADSVARECARVADAEFRRALAGEKGGA